MIIGIPGVNGLGKTKGVEYSPKILLEKSKILKLDSENIESQQKMIYSFISKLDEKLFLIGGDHSISYPLGKVFFEKFPNGKLIVFDAHLDLMQPFKEPTHEEWLRALIEEKNINCKNILLVGVRKNSLNIDKKEREYAKEKGIKVIFSEEFEERKKEILDFILGSPLYVSFDVDVFDPSIFSSTGYLEENGLNECQIFSLLENIFEKDVKFFDLVEYNAGLDSDKKDLNIIRKILKTSGFD